MQLGIPIKINVIASRQMVGLESDWGADLSPAWETIGSREPVSKPRLASACGGQRLAATSEPGSKRQEPLTESIKRCCNFFYNFRI